MADYQILDEAPLNIVWLGQTNTAKIAMIVTQVWQWTPFMFLILLAALSSVNPELYEAASLDGANWRAPLARHHPARHLATSSPWRSSSARWTPSRSSIWSTCSPRADRATRPRPISWYIYQLGFKFFRMGYASAISYLVLIMLSIAATLYVGRFLREEPA